MKTKYIVELYTDEDNFVGYFKTYEYLTGILTLTTKKEDACYFDYKEHCVCNDGQKWSMESSSRKYMLIDGDKIWMGDSESGYYRVKEIAEKSTYEPNYLRSRVIQLIKEFDATGIIADDKNEFFIEWINEKLK